MTASTSSTTDLGQPQPLRLDASRPSPLRCIAGNVPRGAPTAPRVPPVPRRRRSTSRARRPSSTAPTTSTSPTTRAAVPTAAAVTGSSRRSRAPSTACQRHRGQRLQARRQRWHHGDVERHGRGRRQRGRHQPDDRRRRRKRRLGRERSEPAPARPSRSWRRATATYYGVSMTAGDVYTVAGGPSNTLATLSGPTSLLNIGSGNLLFTDGAASSANLDEFSGAPRPPVPVVSSVSPNAGPVGGRHQRDQSRAPTSPGPPPSTSGRHAGHDVTVVSATSITVTRRRAAGHGRRHSDHARWHLGHLERRPVHLHRRAPTVDQRQPRPRGRRPVAPA